MNQRFPTLTAFLASPWILAASDIHVPEDYETLQAAIQASQSGDTILVAPGIYRERIALKPGIHLRSVGPDVPGELGLKRAEDTIIDGGGQVGDTPGVVMAEGATLDGFTVTNVGLYDDAKWQKHWNEKGDNQSHEHIGHFGTPGIAITGVTCAVIHNLVHHIGSTGIAIRGVEGKRCAPIVAANVCYRNMGGGIGSMMGSTAMIDGNTCFENFYAGIGHDGADPLVTRNVCYQNVRAGIGISEGASPVVRQNRCYENRRAGIGVRTGEDTRPVIEENDCYENGMAGIGVEEEAAPIIRGNRCYRNQLAGIGCQEHAKALVVANHCYENQAAGIGSASANPVLLRNQIDNNGTAGIGISGTSKAILIDNSCSENRLVAVGITSESQAILLENTLVRTGGMPPIVAISPEGKAVLVENLIQGGGVAGIMVSGRLHAIANVIEGKNGGSGIFVQQTADATLAENQISGYREPVRGAGAKTKRIE